jgi:arylsulfatase A
MQSVGSFAMRNGNWKLCLCPGSGTPGSGGNAAGNDPSPDVAWRTALEEFKGKPAESDLLRPPFVQLFDLNNDLHEDHNLAAEHPARVKKMVALLRQQVENGRSTPGPKLKNDKNVKIVNINDRRLPRVLRDRLSQ